MNPELIEIKTKEAYRLLDDLIDFSGKDSSPIHDDSFGLPNKFDKILVNSLILAQYDLNLANILSDNFDLILIWLHLAQSSEFSSVN